MTSEFDMGLKVEPMEFAGERIPLVEQMMEVAAKIPDGEVRSSLLNAAAKVLVISSMTAGMLQVVEP